MALYEIDTIEKLQAIDSHKTDECVLIGDIDASATYTWNTDGADGYYGFSPIGMGSTAFNGTFDGQGYKITNLYINRESTTKVGLFSEISGTGGSKYIQNVVIENANITGRNKVGILAGELSSNDKDDLEINNVTVTGSILFTRGEDGVGGIAGTADEVTFDTCSATVSISRTEDGAYNSFVGVLIGYNTDTCDYDDCSAYGSITIDCTALSKSFYIGGFGGYFAGAGSTTLNDCVSSVNISINANTALSVRAGGFAGLFIAGTATKCFSYGSVSSLSTDEALVGGFFGDASGSASMCGSECDIENYSTDATNNHAGGFAGKCGAAVIANCYSKGSVNTTAGLTHTDQRIGGFVGEHRTSGSITYSYSVGQVYATGSPTNGGGFCGLKTLTPTQTALFYDNETSGYTTDGGDATGKTTAEMKTQTTFTAAGWDFTAVWYLPSYTRTPGLGQTIWLSETGDYENFEEDVKDADSFSVALTATDPIYWLNSLQALLVGTSGSEWRIASNNLDTPLTPTNAAPKEQTSYGGKLIGSIKAGDVILFPDSVGKKLREIAFDPSQEKYVAPDLTALADHITGSGIKTMAFQKNPEDILWCTTDDGDLISLVYEREHGVVAWSKHLMDDDVFVTSVCVTPSTTEDVVTISLRRTVNSATKIYIEQLQPRELTDVSSCFFVDSGIVNTGTSATITGLDHLEGKTVAALVDGVYDGTFTVASGQITLNTTPTAKTIVGLAYTSILKPMRLVTGGPNGSTMAAQTRISEIKAVFLNTYGAKYGNDTSDLQSIDFTETRWEDQALITGLFTGDVVLSMPNGIYRENPIFIENSQPYPMTVKAIIADLNQTGY